MLCLSACVSEVYVCKCAYVYVYACVYIHMYVYVYVHACIYMHIHMYCVHVLCYKFFVCVYLCTYRYVYTYIHICRHMCMRLIIYMRIAVHVCFIWPLLSGRDRPSATEAPPGNLRRGDE